MRMITDLGKNVATAWWKDHCAVRAVAPGGERGHDTSSMPSVIAADMVLICTDRVRQC